MPHGAPGVKFYAFEGVDAGKEPIRVQRYLENDGEKPSTKLPENGGVVAGGQWHQNPGLFFLCDFSINTSFAEMFSMFILHSVIQQCINSSFTDLYYSTLHGTVHLMFHLSILHFFKHISDSLVIYLPCII